MADTKRGRQFGNIRKLSSGRYQARYRGPDGKLRPAPSTFQRKNDAARWLSLKEAEISTGEWIAPELGAQEFHEYAGRWMRDRVLKARTAELYDGLLANHLFPAFGDLGLADIDEVTVRRWRKERLETGPKAERPFGPVTVAKAYRRRAGRRPTSRRLQARGYDPSALPHADPAGHLRGHALGRAGRAPAREHRPGHLRNPDHRNARPARQGRPPARYAQVTG